MWTNGEIKLDPDRAPTGVVLFADDGQLLALNDPLIQLLDLDREALASRSIDDLLAPAARVFLQMVLIPMLRLKGRANEMALTLRNAAGTDIHVLCNAVRWIDDKRRPVNHCVFLQVDQRRKLEEQLMQSWRAAEEVPGVIFQLEMNAGGKGRFLHISDGIVRLAGVSAAELRQDAEPLFRQVLPQDRALMEAGMQDKTRQTEPGHYEFRLMRPGAAKPSWFEVHVTPRTLPDGTVLWNGYMADITHQHAIEEQLRENDKLRVTALLASGIAHDFNNLLGSITGLAELSLLAADDGSRLQRNLRNILVATQRATALVRQMLDYSRQTPTQLEKVALAALVRQYEPLLKVSLPSGVGLVLDAERHVQVLADPVQIEQVLLNLVNNAGYAMRERGGTITVSIDTPPKEASPLKIACARLRVADQGCGIDPKDLRNVFQPFFTTKPVGEGTGLGLSAAHGIVKGHGGHIEVQSQPGVGSTFSVWLPLAGVRAKQTSEL